MTDSLLMDIDQFQRHFKIPFRQEGQRPSRAYLQFRIKFVLEELEEFVHAAKRNDLVDMTDALVDLTYIILGTAWYLNIPFYEAWQEVHAANMRKVRAKAEGDSKRKSSYDIIKPADWQAPCISKFFSAEELAIKTPEGHPEAQYDLETYLNELRKRESHEQDTRNHTS